MGKKKNINKKEHFRQEKKVTFLFWDSFDVLCVQKKDLYEHKKN